MFEYWLEPPEEPEPPEPPECPECDEGFGDYVSEKGGKAKFICDTCRAEFEIELYPDYTDDEIARLKEMEIQEPFDHPAHCPHGKAWGECGDCDHAADLDYDAAREQRIRR